MSGEVPADEGTARFVARPIVKDGSWRGAVGSWGVWDCVRGMWAEHIGDYMSKDEADAACKGANAAGVASASTCPTPDAGSPMGGPSREALAGADERTRHGRDATNHREAARINASVLATEARSWRSTVALAAAALTFALLDVADAIRGRADD